MGLRAVFPVAACVVVLIAASATQAQEIIVGTGGMSNIYPFGLVYSGEYQQIYAASAFTGPVLITQIAFASSGPQSAASFTGTLSLGTTSATPSSPGTNYAANKRSDFSSVFTGTKSATLFGTNTFDLVFDINPFVYNPADGNLLLDIVTNRSNISQSFDSSNTADPLVGRIYNFGGDGAATEGANTGLRTRFTASAIPDPSTISLFGVGLLASASRVGAVRRRKPIG